MIGELGEEYTEALRKAWAGIVPGFGDLVTFWFAKAWKQIAAGKLNVAGLVSTNSIRGGVNREVLNQIIEQGSIFEAWSDEEWTVDGAAVRVSLICFASSKIYKPTLNGIGVEQVLSDLTSNNDGVDLTKASLLPANSKTAFLGTKKGRPFDLNADEARRFLQMPINVNGKPDSEVLHRRYIGTDLARRPTDRWIIDFGHGIS